MQLQALLDALQAIAPPHLAQPWDNVGLLAGDPGQQTTRAILTIDYTPEVADEARRAGCDAVIAYHPPIFRPLKRLVAGSVVFDAVRRGVAIYSPHTALDVAEGGTNDALADALGLVERGPLKLEALAPAGYKLVTFVPPTHLAQVSAALFDAGAGRIGNYHSCSFRSSGTGTFFGEAQSHPAVGQSGRLETVEEVRLETLTSAADAPAVVAALRRSHPYETPAFDLIMLASPPAAGVAGMGRIGTLPAGATREQAIERVKRELELPSLLVAGPKTGPLARAAVCAGSCGDLLDDAIAAGAELYLTGEMRHHDALKAAAAGVTVICTLHSNSERSALKRLKQRLESRLGEMTFLLSQADHDPFSIE